MLKKICIAILIIIVGISTNYAYSEEIGLATFQESAQLIIDNKTSQKNIASITLSSSNIQEITIPIELEQKIRENERIEAIVLTNQNNCVLGIIDESCILINVKRNPEDKGINAIQDSTKKIGDEFIDEINQLFDTNAEFFQVYIHTSGEANQEFGTSGIISGEGTVSAVYRMPMEDTNSMYGKISSMLISKQIRDNGGFYDIATDMSTQENAKMTFSIIPTESKILLQLKLSTNTPVQNTITDINPLEFFEIKELNRSNYFSTGNYPLNSIFQIIILSNEETKISNINGNIITTQTVDGMEIPTEITKEGWIFDPREGTQIQGKYIFGESKSVNEDNLKFSIGENNLKFKETESEDMIIIVIIGIISIGAAIFYLKGYKK
jgi:hypothetical protein